MDLFESPPYWYAAIALVVSFIRALGDSSFKINLVIFNEKSRTALPRLCKPTGNYGCFVLWRMGYFIL